MLSPLSLHVRSGVARRSSITPLVSSSLDQVWPAEGGGRRRDRWGDKVIIEVASCVLIMRVSLAPPVLCTRPPSESIKCLLLW